MPQAFIWFASGRSVVLWLVAALTCFALPACAALSTDISAVTWAGWAVCGAMCAWLARVHFNGWRFCRQHPGLVCGSNRLLSMVKGLAVHGEGVMFRNAIEQVTFHCSVNKVLFRTSWLLRRWADADIVDMVNDLDDGRMVNLRTETFIVQAGMPVVLLPTVDSFWVHSDGDLVPAGPGLSLRSRVRLIRMLQGTGLIYATEDDLNAVLRQLGPVELP